MRSTLSVSGMGCTGCESTVESAVSELSGCTGVAADHKNGTVTVEGNVDTTAIEKAIEDSGYEVL